MNKTKKKWVPPDFGPIDTPSSSSKKRNKPSSLKVGPDEFVRNSNHKFVNFIDILKPQKVEDLAVHSKKITEVELWLQQNVINSKRTDYLPILLLTGPTGSGKTATINVLCNKMNIELVEWINPLDNESEWNYSDSQINKFLDFFVQSKYNSLLSQLGSVTLTLVEDFPNFVIHNSKEFVKVLEKCQNGNTPVVFICSDTANSRLDLSQSLFPQAIREQFQISTINFNPCASTLLKTLLIRCQKIAQKYPEKFKVPSSDVIDAIISSTMGDIRCTINQYQFSSLKGTSEISMVSNLNTSCSSKRKRNDKKSSSIVAMCRNESLGIFHGLGRVLNPKRIEVKNSWRLQCDFNALIDQFGSQPSTFNAFLQENYLKYFGNFEDVQNAADILSFAQLFFNNWIDHQDVLVYGIWTAALGLMVHNNHKVSKWNQIKGPTKVNRTNTKSEIPNLDRTDYLYYNLITKTDKLYTFKVKPRF